MVHRHRLERPGFDLAFGRAGRFANVHALLVPDLHGRDRAPERLGGRGVHADAEADEGVPLRERAGGDFRRGEHEGEDAEGEAGEEGDGLEGGARGGTRGGGHDVEVELLSFFLSCRKNERWGL